jgi:hypothetical protein
MRENKDLLTMWTCRCIVSFKKSQKNGRKGEDVHITEHYNMDCTQAAVDFVDVDITTDNAVFIDPRAIRLQRGLLQDECAGYLVSFFSEILDAIHDNRPDHIRELMRMLGEPNETHLGYSRGKPQGRGLAGKRATEFADAISGSKAAKTGLLQDLEDTALFVPKVGSDLMSDMATQILRGPLIRYTQLTCEYHGIDMEEQYSGPIWNSDSLEWDEMQVDLPRTPQGTLILIPKPIVRHSPILDSGKYFSGYIAPFLEGEELERGSDLVKLLRNGRRYVTKKDLAEKYGDDKPAVVNQTLRLDKKPLERYRQVAGTITSSPLVNEDLAETLGSEQVDFIGAYEKVIAVSPGMAGAHYYHHAVEELLTAIFYPSLGNRHIEKEINKGRKRIDIVYDNVATTGFFDWAGRHYNCPTVPVECKNYQHDINNPELDQMIGRFSNDRGRLGLIVCRSFADKRLFIERCRDTSKDGHGFIIPLDDADLKKLAEKAAELQFEVRKQKRFEFSLMRERFDQLIA